jgi:hypothetical protein
MQNKIQNYECCRMPKLYMRDPTVLLSALWRRNSDADVVPENNHMKEILNFHEM